MHLKEKNQKEQLFLKSCQKTSSKHGWKTGEKKREAFPLVADKATWVWTPTDKSAGAEGKIVIGFTLLQDADAAGVSCYFSMFGCQENLVKIIKTET